MDKFWEAIKEKLNVPLVILMLGVLLLIVGSSSTISIGSSSSQISLSQQTRLVLWIPALVLMGVGLWQLRTNSRKTIKSREKITSANIQLIGIAEQEVISFSGDLSWTTDCHSALLNAIDRGVRVRILCKDPLTAKAKSHVERYLQQTGVEVRYYPPDLDPDVRGLMIDPLTTKQALLVEKKHKTKGYDYQRDGTAGTTKNYEYWGQHFTADTDLAVVAPLAKLFDALWELSLEATVLQEGDWSTIENELRKLRQYHQTNINMRIIGVADLKPLHRFIDLSRNEAAKLLLKRMKRHGLPLWKGFSLSTSAYRKTVCPPIIEKHNGEFVIVDGLARIYQAKRSGVSEVTVCVIEGVSEPLVGVPWTWDKVRVVADHDYSKQENFQNFAPDYWRQFKSLGHSLTQPS